jgi:tol-pal system protein YbgF
MAMSARIRFRAFFGLSAALLAPLALAQTPGPDPRSPDPRVIERRVTTLEGQMRAVQRQVFPGGDPRFFAPDAPAPPEAGQPGTPAGAPLIDLQARVDALELQQRELTGQVEQLQFRLRQLEEGQTRARADIEFRLDALEGKGTAPATGAATAPGAATAAATPAPSAAGTENRSLPSGSKPAPVRQEPPRPDKTGAEPASPAGDAARPAPDDLEARYRAAFALYEARDYAAAAPALEAFARANPAHPRASNAQYWAGRAVMAQGRHPEAAKLFLAGYQSFPKGQRAAENLLWLGKALTEMKQPKAACQALDQLRTAYPDRLTGVLGAEATKARAAASCSA